jgi:hypothetical protein
MCPPAVSARICLNQQLWLANRLREERIDFRQCANAFMHCAAPRRLQELADEPARQLRPEMACLLHVAMPPHSRRYQLLPNGYSICLVFLRLFERVYGPLTAGLLAPMRAAATLPSQRGSQLDRLYHGWSMSSTPHSRHQPQSRLTQPSNVNKILIRGTIAV